MFSLILVNSTKKMTPDADVTLFNGFLSVVISNTTGRISSISNEVRSVTIDVDQNVSYKRAGELGISTKNSFQLLEDTEV